MSAAREKTYVLMNRLSRAGIDTTFTQAETLRRAELTLTRCAERECGDGSNYCLERDEDTGKTYNVHIDSGKRSRCPDRETGAIGSVADTCKALGLSFFHQTDPRGPALYVSQSVLTTENYSSIGTSCCS